MTGVALLKGDEGGPEISGGGVAENGDFRQGSHYPLAILGGGSVNLSVTGNGGPRQR